MNRAMEKLTYEYTDITDIRDIRTRRHTDIYAYTQTYRHTDIQACRHADMQPYRQTEIETSRQYRPSIHTGSMYIHAMAASARALGA